jgi:hypothetical protein
MYKCIKYRRNQPTNPYFWRAPRCSSNAKLSTTPRSEIMQIVLMWIGYRNDFWKPGRRDYFRNYRKRPSFYFANCFRSVFCVCSFEASLIYRPLPCRKWYDIKGRSFDATVWEVFSFIFCSQTQTIIINVEWKWYLLTQTMLVSSYLIYYLLDFIERLCMFCWFFYSIQLIILSTLHIIIEFWCS